MPLQKRGAPATPAPVLVVGVFCVLEALLLSLLSNFGLIGPTAPPLAFEELWFQRQGPFSLQETLMGGNVLLAVVLWGCYRVPGPQEAKARLARSAAYVGAGVLLAGVQWACRALSIAAPEILLTRIYP